MTQLFEAFMVICFGISWPMAILKSLKSKTTKGKSLVFLIFILTGYAFGILGKLLSSQITYVLTFYIINFLMVAFDLSLYFRNLKLDQGSIAPVDTSL